jgi:predicted TIM-barrel fold metal-dependent hydrolase
MFRTAQGEEIFVVDAHCHFWDASPANQLNKYGRGWIDCFYAYHKTFTPPNYLWTLEKYEKYPAEGMLQDQFVKGYVDMGILQSTYLTDFYKDGFNTIEQNNIVKQMAPDRYILNGAFDPRDGDKGLDYLRHQKNEYGIKGVKLYTAEWKGDSKGFKLSSPESYRFLEECVKLGIKNIHVHKGPTIYPLNKDAFDVSDVDEAASLFTDLNFIVEHCGLPRIEDFCYIATQESNVYAGLAVILPFTSTRKRAFAEMMAQMMYWIGPDKILFGSDYAIWEPKWIIENFMAFQFPEDLQAEFGVKMDLENRRKILGLNAARLYDIDVNAQIAKLKNDTFSQQAAAQAAQQPSAAD